MNCYEWTILNDDIVLATGEKVAANAAQMEIYIAKVLIPKHPAATNFTYKQLFCSCGSDHDVAAYYVKERRVVECFECRTEYFRSTRNYGILKGDM